MFKNSKSIKIVEASETVKIFYELISRGLSKHFVLFFDNLRFLSHFNDGKQTFDTRVDGGGRRLLFR